MPIQVIGICILPEKLMQQKPWVYYIIMIQIISCTFKWDL